MTDAQVNLWGRRIGAVSWVRENLTGVFQYDPKFLSAGIELSPIVMPVREPPYEFRSLNRETFMGLPGLLSDSLPDRFGNRLIEVWLAETGRTNQDFNPVDRLCYVGKRATGALEFEPVIEKQIRRRQLYISQLTDLANRILNDRMQLTGRLKDRDDTETLSDILQIGTSAGGARAKAVLAWNPITEEFRSGQVGTNDGFQHWILKFDGVSDKFDRDLAAPSGFGKIEYAYYLMALEAGIQMSDCRLYHEGDRSHFMTRRFDRDETGRKIHMLTLGAMQHYDFNESSAYSYEQAMQTIRALGLGMPTVEELFRRTMFNIVARNQDDHVKNISFLMDRAGVWQLSPAYDVVYAFNPSGLWTRDHQMSMSGKRNDFEITDILRFAQNSGLKKRTAMKILDEVVAAVSDWRRHAAEADVEPTNIKQIERTHRTYLSNRIFQV